MARHVATLQAFLCTCSPCRCSLIAAVLSFWESYLCKLFLSGSLTFTKFFLEVLPSKIIFRSVTCANIKGWGSTKSPFHPWPLSNIKLVNKPFIGLLVGLKVFHFLWPFLYLRTLIFKVVINLKASPVWTRDKVISTSFHKETIFNPPLKHLTCWQ